jgi:hypothetical protein
MEDFAENAPIPVGALTDGKNLPQKKSPGFHQGSSYFIKLRIIV